MSDFSNQQQPEFVAPPTSNGPTFRAAAMVASGVDVLSRPGVPAPLNLGQNVLNNRKVAPAGLTLAPITPRLTSVAHEKPFHVATNSSFIVKTLSYEEIQSRVTLVLSNIIDYDFSYIADKYQVSSFDVSSRVLIS